MSTTTIRLEEELKTRVAAAAERSGKTAHAFMLDAIVQTVEDVELNAEFHRVAEERWGRIIAGGKTLSLDEAVAYLEARARGERVRKPAGRKPSR